MSLLTRKFWVGEPMQPIFPWLALGFCIGGNANFMFCVGDNTNFSFFRYQLVGVLNAKLWWGSKPTPGPNVNGFASQWNIGFNYTTYLFVAGAPLVVQVGELFWGLASPNFLCLLRKG